MTAATRARLLLAARVAAWVLVACCVLLFARNLHWAQVRASFASADMRLALFAMVVWSPCTIFQGLRWYSLIRAVRPVPATTVLAATYVGYGASAILPMRAGEAVRVHLLARAGGLSRAVSLGTLAIDHTVNGTVMFLFAASLPLILPVPAWLAVVVWVGVAGAVGLVLLLLRLSQRPSAVREGKLHDVIARLRGGLIGLRNPRAIIPAILAAALAWMVEIASTALALAAFHLPHDVPHAMGVLFGVNLALAIPSPPANLGNFELGAGAALVAFGGAADHAAAFALGYHALQLIPTVLGALVCLPRFRKSRLAQAPAEA